MPRVCSASARRPIETCSPVEAITSSSRTFASGSISFASARSRLVSPAMADGTTTSWWPSLAKCATRRATSRIRSRLPMEVPPYFWTIRDKRTSAVVGGDRLDVFGEDALRLRLAERRDELQLHRVIPGPHGLEPVHARGTVPRVRVAVHLRRDRREPAVLEVVFPREPVGRAARLVRREALLDLPRSRLAPRRRVFGAAFLEPRVLRRDRLRAHRRRLAREPRLHHVFRELEASLRTDLEDEQREIRVGVGRERVRRRVVGRHHHRRL